MWVNDWRFDLLYDALMVGCCRSVRFRLLKGRHGRRSACATTLRVSKPEIWPQGKVTTALSKGNSRR
jgi:hypothetical protein